LKHCCRHCFTRDIDRIGAWCIEHACRIAKQWPDDLTLSVNLSPVQFNSGRLIANLRKILDNTHYPAYRLELEITEGIVMGDAEFIHTQLRSLQEMGVRVALDDFGTGYSSLSYLWKFPLSRIKIDQSFIRQRRCRRPRASFRRSFRSATRLAALRGRHETSAQLAFLSQIDAIAVRAACSAARFRQPNWPPSS
jgi:EAL domain-containing protein (putative c-di-GMP-specific phosphodiesterase class I)